MNVKSYVYIIFFLSGINISLTSFPCFPQEVKTFDLVINEIMADPYPSVGLPECEYIEIHNRSDKTLSTENLFLFVGTKSKEIPQVLITAGNYLVLCPTGKSNDFAMPDKCLEINGFPTLNNSGQRIGITNKSNEIICFVIYEKFWYNNEFKAQGGWSLEQIDTNNPCGCYFNWTSSTNLNGGTPGKRNSVGSNNPDLKNPEFQRIAINEFSKITVIFDEPMQKTSISDPDIYSIQDYYFDQYITYPIPPDFSSLELSLPFNMVEGEIYTLFILPGPVDCVGNALEANNSIKFAWPQKPENNDIIITEILFDPFPGGSEFIELYNLSEKCIDLNDLYLTNKMPGSYDGDEPSQIFSSSFLLFSGEYILISENKYDISSRYNCPYPGRLLNIKDLPGLVNSGGSLYLINRWEEIIDEVYFSDDMHHPLLAKSEGVSLERIVFDGFSLDLSNWHSASSSSGFATPGYTNSQSVINPNKKSNIELLPDVFSPDNDGYNDVLQINYDFKQNGLSGSIKIYDANGRLIKEILNNGLFGSSGTNIWNGTNSEGEVVAAGIYIVFIKVFDTEGNVWQYKKCCVLALK